MDFKEALAALNMIDLNAVRYGMKYGGASPDLLSGARSLQEVKRRGVWKSDSSLKRYGKETRAMSEVHKTLKNSMEYGKRVSAQLPEVLLGTMRLPPHPCPLQAVVDPHMQRCVRRRLA